MIMIPASNSIFLFVVLFLSVFIVIFFRRRGTHWRPRPGSRVWWRPWLWSRSRPWFWLWFLSVGVIASSARWRTARTSRPAVASTSVAIPTGTRVRSWSWSSSASERKRLLHHHIRQNSMLLCHFISHSEETFMFTEKRHWKIHNAHERIRVL